MKKMKLTVIYVATLSLVTLVFFYGITYPATIEEGFTDIEKGIATLKVELSGLETKFVTVQQIEDIRIKLTDLDLSTSTLTQQITEMKIDKEQLVQVQNKLTQLSTELKELKTQVETLTARVTGNEVRIKSTDDKVANIEKSIPEIQEGAQNITVRLDANDQRMKKENLYTWIHRGVTVLALLLAIVK